MLDSCQFTLVPRSKGPPVFEVSNGALQAEPPFLGHAQSSTNVAWLHQTIVEIVAALVGTSSIPLFAFDYRRNL